MSQSYWLFYLRSTNVKTGCISAGARMGTPRKHMVPDLSKAVNRIFSSYLCQAFNSDILNHMLKRRTVSQSVSINNVPSLLPEFRLKIKVT